MATATIGRWGNANAIRIPKALCEEVGFSPDDVVSVEAKKIRGLTSVIDADA